jgi:hypothetical protein
MNPSRSLLTAVAFLAVGVSAGQTAAAGCHCRRPAPDRGIAVMSPLESPDPCDSPVGGCYRYTPYYPGYAPDRRCMILYGQSPWTYGAATSRAPGYRPADYGPSTGGSRDEAGLLRLGGNGGSAPGTYGPSSGGDLLDRIHGRQP